jgi:hypothetical protein
MLQPATLGYDDLPAGSDIRREFLDGGVRIAVPAGEAPREAIREAAKSALAWGAAVSAALVLLAWVIFVYGVRINGVSGIPLLWARAFFAIFCAAVVMLVAWVRYGVISDAIRAGRTQSTALAADRSRLMVETDGAFGAASYDLPAERIRSIVAGQRRLEDDRRSVRRMNCLVIHLNDGRDITLLPGRSPRELKWIAAAIGERLGVRSGALCAAGAGGTGGGASARGG